MNSGLTPKQEIVEVRLDDKINGSIADAVNTVLRTKPRHRIVSLSTFAGGEFGTWIRAVLVIEFLVTDGGSADVAT